MSTDYPPDWNTRRKDVYQRDGHQCQNCGRQGGPQGDTELHAHHIVPKSKGGTHQRSNLITVCKDCHNAIHGESTAPSNTRRGLNENEFGIKLIKIMNNIMKSDAASNDAIERLYDLFASNIDDGGFMIDEYSSLRYEIIKQAFKTKEQIETYRSDIRPYLKDEARIDIDAYIDATRDSIKSKIFVTSHADDILMEFSQRDIKCTECGKVVDPNADFCKHCGDKVELVAKCSSCGNELDADSSFCSQCGTEIQDEIKTDEQMPVNERAINDHADEMIEELEDTIRKATLVQLLEQRFELVYGEDCNIVWDYCPNCGFKRGVVSKNRSGECILCNAEWIKKGILNTYWKGESVPNVESVKTKDNSEINWNKIGKDKFDEEIYHSYVDDLIEEF